MKNLKRVLLSIDNKHTSNYRELHGSYFDIAEGQYIDLTYAYQDIRFEFDNPHRLDIDRPVLNLGIPLHRLGLEWVLSEEKFTATTVCDFALRCFAPYITNLDDNYRNEKKDVVETGSVAILQPGQEVFMRNASRITDDGYLYIMVQLVLPSRNGKVVNGKKAVQILTKDIPHALDLFIAKFDQVQCRRCVTLALRQTKIRQYLRENGYVAFVANGSILPRAKGTDLPLTSAIPFSSPPSLDVRIDVSDDFSLSGMALRQGITVVTGGGYSGKSTLLDALESGVYNHIEGDGREYVITDNTAVKIYAEDGRPVTDLDLSPFIKYLPLEESVERFTTHHASGSTSQAANIIESINAGTRLLLIDEDKSATNFMIRDSNMKRVVLRDPIIPFTDRVRELYEDRGVSTVLVIGGSSEYFTLADEILVVEDFRVYHRTDEIKRVVELPIVDAHEQKARWEETRVFDSAETINLFKQLSITCLSVTGRNYIAIGDEAVDITMLTAIKTRAQSTALAHMLRYFLVDDRRAESVSSCVKRICERIEAEGLDSVYSSMYRSVRWMEMPRPLEFYSVLCRLRNLSFEAVTEQS